MMRARHALAVSITIVLAGCGGGSAAPTLPVNAPLIPATATFQFKIPSASAMAKLRRPAYVSQATQGVAIDWTSTNPMQPDYAAAVAAACPNTLPAGVVSCSTNAQGTDYTFQLAISPGTYTLTVSTFDQPPSGTPGTFGTGAHMLAQGQLASPFVVTAGQANAIPSMTFFGVPASVAFAPAPAQAHAVPFGAGYAIVGNVAQLFFAQALDAQGFAIGSSDAGAPSLTVAESGSDPTPYLTIASTANRYEFSVQAKQVPASGAAPADVVITAAAGGGLTATATANVAIEPVEELWLSQSAGGSSTQYGLAGYPLYPPSYSIPVTSRGLPIDFIYDSGAGLCGSGQCQFQAAAGGANGSIVAKSASSGRLYEFSPTSSFTTPSLPTSALPYASSSISNVAMDAAGHLFVLDNAAGTLTALTHPTDSTYAAQTIGPAGGQALAVAPSIAAIPSVLQQTIWTSDSSGNYLVYKPFTGAPPLQTIPVTFVGGTPPPAQTIGFDASGRVWILASYIYIYTMSGNQSGLTLTFDMTMPYVTANGEAGSSFGSSVSGTMWIPSFASYNVVNALTATGCPSCSVSATQTNLNVDADAAFVEP